MADKYGSYYNNGSYNVFRAAIRYETTDNGTSVTVRCRSWCQMGEGHDSSSNIQGRAYITDTYSAWVTGDGTYLNAGDESGFLGDITKTIQKGESAQTITCSGQVWGSTWDAYSPWVNANVTIPALTSWNVTYNANGGSGAPATQKKYQGKTLTLSSTKPTRSGYTFQGWATSSNGTVAYKAGASYTGNAALSLYAVWKANATAPTITSLSAYRSTSGTRDDESTTQFTFSCKWTKMAGASATLKLSYTDDGGTAVTKTISLTAADSSGTSSGSYTIALADTSRMVVTATLTDSTHSLTATRAATIGPVFKPFHLSNKGYGAAFFGIAGATWNRILTIFGDLHLSKSNPTVNMYSGSAVDQIGTSVPSSNVTMTSRRDYDSSEHTSWYSQLVRNTSDTLYRSWVVQRLDASGTNVQHGFYLYIDANGKPRLGFTSNDNRPVRRAWHEAISGWTSIATTSGTTAKTWTDLSAQGYNEVLVVCKYSTTYASSVTIPVAALTSTATDWYLGGWYVSSAYAASCKMTLTGITPYKIRAGGSSDVNGSWTVYAR